MDAHIPENVIVVSLEGKLEAAEVERLTSRAEAMLARFEEVGMLVDASGLKGVSADALARDITWEIKHIRDWERFKKIALITENGFLAGVTRAMGALMPQIEVRAFENDERVQALEFVSGVPVKPLER
ncbi:STAS/SEC14 domain-containing protein [Pelagibacterium xiamenense]|uniref:STAS/SEC14 domain-containing protein n=1 Tax=Pelagibacterium xiamenense TaxID=2901140 RepID=UPI001E367787|nr:STAS/SEC14 domain-containing protein [Pelagibacterium xiamenense]MCD7060850.1 STAS/SEC14 domain-containing protein [Pelagibacterium xiamenense]